MGSRMSGWKQASLVLFALSACAEEPPCLDPNIWDNPRCPLDSCVQYDDDLDKAMACCIEAHGYGLTPEEAERCAGDCDPSDYLSAEAALCAAQVQGLPQGIGSCHSDFNPPHDEGPGHWIATTRTGHPCVPGSHGDRYGYVLNGITGERDGQVYISPGYVDSVLDDCSDWPQLPLCE